MNWQLYINDALSETLDEEAAYSMLLQQTKRSPKYLRQQMIDCKLGKSKSISTVNNGNIIEVKPEKVKKCGIT